MALTSKELAQKLGVSTATISLVLNGKKGISDKTRLRVVQQIKELGYGDMLKESAATAEEKTSDPASSVKNIGFVIYKNNGMLLGMNSFLPLILDGIESSARNHGYNLLLISIERGDIENQIKYIQAANCKGYVIFATELQEEDLYYFDQIQLPYIVFDNYFIDRNINCIKVNNEQGTYLAVKCLHRLGHRKVGYLSSGLEINSFKEREKFAKSAIRFFKMEAPDRYSYTIGYPNDTAETNMLQLLQNLSKSELPTAFLADNDLVAVGAIQALKKSGIRVPDDISVIGYDDRPICELIDPPLTTIRLPRAAFGAEAVERLIYMLERSSDQCIKVEINGELVMRSSTSAI